MPRFPVDAPRDRVRTAQLRRPSIEIDVLRTLMKQNKYDDPEFFAQYSQMPRSVGGLDEALEWPYFRDLLPDLCGKRLLDLGCGFGWHCRYARQQGARSVIGADLSEKMLARARAADSDAGIAYLLSAIEDIDFPPDSFDVVASSLALHYVERFDRVCQQVNHCLADGGAFAISVEHPTFTARAAQDWHFSEGGERLHWPVDHYDEHGLRRTSWLAADVVKYHRTIAAYVNTLIDSGFQITRLVEPSPSIEMAIDQPQLKDERRRPMFLLIGALKH